jgi:ribosomal protein L11 methyltransferase
MSGTPQCWKLTLPCTREEAEALNDDRPQLALLEPPPALMTHEPDEDRPDHWEVHAYFEGKPDAASVALIQSFIPSAALVPPLLERLPDEDWVTLSQQGLEPVSAGRFYVHTAANKGVAPPGAKAFRIEASQAFGTGGHETTTGCLQMLDRLKRRGAHFDHIADIGTGTGLLAFAANHLWPRALVTASDIDAVSIEVTAENAQANGVALGTGRGQVALCLAPGTDHAMIRARASYDLVIANILAGPLIELAPALACIMGDRDSLILAGLLDSQVAAVASAYRAQGLRLVTRIDNGRWPCLQLVKRPRFGWRRPVRTSGRTSQPPGDFGTW